MSQVSFLKRHVAFEHELQHYPLNISLSSFLLFFFFMVEQSLEYKDDATDSLKNIYGHTLPRKIEKAPPTLPPRKPSGTYSSHF